MWCPLAELNVSLGRSYTPLEGGNSTQIEKNSPCEGCAHHDRNYLPVYILIEEVIGGGFGISNCLQDDGRAIV